MPDTRLNCREAAYLNLSVQLTGGWLYRYCIGAISPLPIWKTKNPAYRSHSVLSSFAEVLPKWHPLDCLHTHWSNFSHWLFVRIRCTKQKLAVEPENNNIRYLQIPCGVLFLYDSTPAASTIKIYNNIKILRASNRAIFEIVLRTVPKRSLTAPQNCQFHCR
jgi:hypothetical protein